MYEYSITVPCNYFLEKKVKLSSTASFAILTQLIQKELNNIFKDVKIQVFR